MREYKTPGVYVEEISKLPPSVAGVATAIPGFVGITEKNDNESPSYKVVRVESLLDFEEKFGGAQKLSVDDNGNLQGDKFVLYDSIRLFYDNGGGTCYVVSIGTYEKNCFNAEDFTKGIDALNEEDSITMLLAPDAVTCLDNTSDVYKKMLDVCGELGDRVAILDVKMCKVKDKDDIKSFRDNIGTNNLSYGAAYYPYLRTSYTKQYDSVSIIKCAINRKERFVTEETDKFKKLFPDTQLTTPTPEVKEAEEEAEEKVEEKAEEKIHFIKKIESKPEYKKFVAELLANANIIPPSGAIAGIYCKNDAKSGVWQAPANISLSSVSNVTVRITDNQQESMNVDNTDGKSVNAIRLFQGKGIIVWGARTLDGFSNEWRYISVRRLFNYIEESVKKSTSWAVFQPNDANTWVNVQCQIENFLSNLWRDGALAGSTPAQAFRVGVGLNVTMTAQDILEGKLIVEIGIAAVRPAEFIILRFSHKLQEA